MSTILHTLDSITDAVLAYRPSIPKAPKQNSKKELLALEL